MNLFSDPDLGVVQIPDRLGQVLGGTHFAASGLFLSADKQLNTSDTHLPNTDRVL